MISYMDTWQLFLSHLDVFSTNYDRPNASHRLADGMMSSYRMYSVSARALLAQRGEFIKELGIVSFHHSTRV